MLKLLSRSAWSPASQTPRGPQPCSQRAPVLPRAAMQVADTGPREGVTMTGEGRPERRGWLLPRGGDVLMVTVVVAVQAMNRAIATHWQAAAAQT